MDDHAVQRVCPEYGVDAPSMDVHEIPEIVRGNAASWRQVLARPDVRRRRRPGVWSPPGQRDLKAIT